MLLALTGCTGAEVAGVIAAAAAGAATLIPPAARALHKPTPASIIADNPQEFYWFLTKVSGAIIGALILALRAGKDHRNGSD